MYDDHWAVVCQTFSICRKTLILFRSVVPAQRPGRPFVRVRHSAQVAGARRPQRRHCEVHHRVPARRPREPPPLGGHGRRQQDHQRHPVAERKHSLPVQSQGFLQSTWRVEQVCSRNDPRGRWVLSSFLSNANSIGTLLCLYIDQSHFYQKSWSFYSNVQVKPHCCYIS